MKQNVWNSHCAADVDFKCFSVMYICCWQLEPEHAETVSLLNIKGRKEVGYCYHLYFIRLMSETMEI